MGVARGDNLDSGVEILWDPQIFRKVIQRSERQHAESFLRARDDRCDRADRPVPAAGRDYRGVAIHRPFREPFDLFPAPSEVQVDLDAVARESISDRLLRFGLDETAAGCIDYHLDRRHRIQVSLSSQTAAKSRFYAAAPLT